MFVTLCFLCLLLPTLNADADVQVLVARMEARYRPARTLQATFLQRYTENGRLIRAEAGTVYFRRPGKMRWEYESPEKNVFLVDGKTAWFYVPADHTVTRVPAKESSDWRTPLALLAGKMKVSRVCAKVAPALDEKAEASEDVVLSCELPTREPASGKPASQEAITQNSGSETAVFFEVARQTGQLMRILVRQSGGVSLEFRFANWQFDPPLPELLFHFAPPMGVAVVELHP
jgi:outer membrane lipoprotein carrier protein